MSAWFPDDFAAPPRRRHAAHIIADDAEAIAAAKDLAADFARGAATRDRERHLPHDEIERLSAAGLFAITVPRTYGGAGVSAGTLAEVTAILSAADGSIGQIPQNHFFMLEALRLQGTEAQKRFFYDRILAGERLGNALSERGTRTAHDHATRLIRDGAGYRLQGRKFYSTGVLFADWVAVVANDEAGRSTIAFVPRDTAGITLIDDWSGFGQRTTGSGTTVLDNVPVHAFSVLPFAPMFERPTPMGPLAQIIHTGVQQGIARAALADTLSFVRAHARPWKDSGVEHGYDDPYTISGIGEVMIRVEGAEALLVRAGAILDRAIAEPGDDSVAAASIAVAEAKAASTEAALLASSRLIEYSGTASTLAEHNLDRHWRNARTHSVHDPVRWKYHAIGNYWLNNINPPRHGAL
jgi:SfnB family sulfur acquisition oxidoreductase